MLVRFKINGDPVEVNLKSADRLLVDVLREDLRLTGAKEGCGKGECGACTVLVDGQAVDSCLMMAYQADGTAVETIEGLVDEGRMHPLQEAFIEKGGVQCGICIPGHVMAACALLEKTPDPSDEEIRASADSVYCRCTGYIRIFEAYHEAVALAKARTS